MTVQLKVTGHDNITPSLRKMVAKLAMVPQEAFKEFVKDTPVRTGNARRNTKLTGKTITANYPYAQKLDEGYSQQSPDGMTKPTEAFIKKRVSQILKGK